MKRTERIPGIPPEENPSERLEKKLPPCWIFCFLGIPALWGWVDFCRAEKRKNSKKKKKGGKGKAGKAQQCQGKEKDFFNSQLQDFGVLESKEIAREWDLLQDLSFTEFLSVFPPWPGCSTQPRLFLGFFGNFPRKLRIFWVFLD